MKALCAVFFLLLFPLTIENSNGCPVSSYLPNTNDPGAAREMDVNSVLITEIMADPNPPASLPDAEYIELFNRGKESISLDGWSIQIGKPRITLPPVMLPAGGYALVCEAQFRDRFDSGIRFVGVNKLPAILNTGQILILRSPSGKQIHTVEFSDHWYQSPEKAGGGWSLEMIDPENPCGRADNWGESVDPRGGTPGEINSVWAVCRDQQQPKLFRATVKSGSAAILYFSEPMDSLSLCDPSSYSGSFDLLQPLSAIPVGPENTSVQLNFASPFHAGITYTVTVLNTLHDCVGNPLDPNAFAEFALPEPIDSSDLVINEILPDTHSGQSEFVELYNRSTQVVDIAHTGLVLCSGLSANCRKPVFFTGYPYLLFPGHCVAITRDTSRLPNEQHHLNPAHVLEIPSLFILPDQEGTLLLLREDSAGIDRFHYLASMHSPYLSETKGVSLERIDPDSPTQDAGNWCSAASTSGFATPGEINSQHGCKQGQPEQVILSPVVFSPDGDGLDDELILTVNPATSGFLANILICDERGRKIATLASHTLLGTENRFAWNGIRDDHHRADIGMYLIYIEIFNIHGLIQKYSKVVTLVRKL